MKKAALIAFALTLTACATAQAGVTLSGFYYNMNDAADNTPAAPCKTILVVDRDNDGVAGLPLAGNAPTDTFLFDPEDWIVEGQFGGFGGPVKEWYEMTGDYGANQYMESASYYFEYGPNGLAQNMKLFLFWFPTVTNIDATEPGPNAPFGVVQLQQVLQADFNTFGFDQSTAWGFSDAGYVTAPEPATLLLLAVGGGLAALRRRRSR